MKKLPLDVKLLQIGLKYAQLRASGANFQHLFEDDASVAFDQIHESIYQNLKFIHAKVDD